jgi:hypothetical protein
VIYAHALRYYIQVTDTKPLTFPPPDGYILLEQNPRLQSYDESLNRTFHETRVFRPEHLAKLERTTQLRVKSQFGTLESNFKNLYQNDELFRISRQLIKDLTKDKTRFEPREQILRSFERLSNDQIENDMDLWLFDWIESRPARWLRLLESLELPSVLPLGFRLFRGVQETVGAFKFIPQILRAWQEEALFFEPPHHPLASWSFQVAPAKAFATNFGNGQAGVLMGADIPFEQINGDKLVDGGNYLLWWDQYEATVGSRNINVPIVADPRFSQIFFKGQWFGINDKQKLEKIIS